jgi:hypothetical protein
METIMPKSNKETDTRWDLALDAIDEGLASEELPDRLQAAVAYAMMDLADSLDVVSQHVEMQKGKPIQTRTRRASKSKDEEE